ncbi:MAG TPA: sigma-54 dependent transcriptional regulator [Gemmataceae bacterium]|nr:sigma-54 dependent transcriptional regulator [Gemmataceae bacterium]
MPTLLIVDDEPSILHAFRRAFRDDSVEVRTAETAADGLQRAAERRPDVAVLDVHLPDMNGLEMLRRLREIDSRSPVIFISGRGDADDAIEAMKLGAFDYLVKPLELSQVREVVGRALTVSRAMRVPAVVAGDGPVDERADVIIARCPAMQEVVKAVGRVADKDVAVLVAGATGTGKELIARALYQHSRRASGPFLAVNCAAIPEQLLESELFGHEKGAFTGADRRRIGKFEQCNGGTLFLDEVGDMSPLTQSKVLRVLQEQRFERVGGDETIRTDARILAATNINLEEAVAGGRFRADLYYRLSVFTIALPPLRDRGQDLPLLINHYVRRYSRELGSGVASVAPETMDLLCARPWPGNVRELQSVLLTAVLHATGPVLPPESLPSAAAATAAPSAADLEQFIDAELKRGSQTLYAEALERLERLLLPRVLRYTSGNQLRAAAILGIARGSLRTKLRDLGLRVDRGGAGDDAALDESAK